MYIFSARLTHVASQSRLRPSTQPLKSTHSHPRKKTKGNVMKVEEEEEGRRDRETYLWACSSGGRKKRGKENRSSLEKYKSEGSGSSKEEYFYKELGGLERKK